MKPGLQTLLFLTLSTFTATFRNNQAKKQDTVIFYPPSEVQKMCLFQTKLRRAALRILKRRQSNKAKLNVAPKNR